MNTENIFFKIVTVILLIQIIRYWIHRIENRIEVHDTWSLHIVNYGISIKKFYSVIQELIEHKHLPDVHIKQVALPENGWPSRKRLFLRVTRKTVIYFIIAFPVGADFFISYRMGFRQPQTELTTHRNTFYQTDSEKAFTESMHKIILQAIDMITKQYGNRQTN